MRKSHTGHAPEHASSRAGGAPPRPTFHLPRSTRFPLPRDENGMEEEGGGRRNRRSGGSGRASSAKESTNEYRPFVIAVVVVAVV